VNPPVDPDDRNQGRSGSGGPTRETPSRDELRRRGVAAYQGALEAVLAIALAAGVGYWADQRFGTAPRWLIVGTCIGFGAFVLRLWRMRNLFDEGPPKPPGSRGGRG
jgi:F0F1-type ATP synthase assembly protein I